MKTHPKQPAEGLGQVFSEPKIVLAKLGITGVLHFTTSVNIAAYQVLVSSSKLFLPFLKDNLGNPAVNHFVGIVSTSITPEDLMNSPDLVVIIRIKSVSRGHWSRWYEEVDVSEFYSAHRPPLPPPRVPENDNQMASLPEVIPPRNGEHGVNGNGKRLSRRQFAWQSLDALLEPLKLMLWPRNGHDNDNQQKTPEPKENEIMKKKNASKSITLDPLGTLMVPPTNGADGYLVYVVSDDKVVGTFTGEFTTPGQIETVEHLMSKVQFTSPSHPSEKEDNYAVKVSLSLNGGTTITEPQVFGLTGKHVKALYDKGQASSGQPAPVMPPSAMADAIAAATASKAAPAAAQPAPTPAPVKVNLVVAAPNTAPAAAKPLSSYQLSEIARLTKRAQLALEHVRNGKNSGVIKKKLLNDTAEVLDTMEPQVASLQPDCHENIKWQELNQLVRALDTEWQEAGATYKNQLQQEQLRNAHVASAASAPAATQVQQPAPAPAQAVQRPQQVQQTAPAGQAPAAPAATGQAQNTPRIVMPARGPANPAGPTPGQPSATASPATPKKATGFKKQWPFWLLILVFVILAIVAMIKLAQRANNSDNGLYTRTSDDAAEASVNAGTTNASVAKCIRSGDGKVNIAVAVGNISGSNNIPITFNIGSEQAQAAKKPEWYESDTDDQTIPLTPAYNGQVLFFSIPSGKHYRFVVPAGWTVLMRTHKGSWEFEQASGTQKLAYGQIPQSDNLRYLNKSGSSMELNFTCVLRVQPQKKGFLRRIF